MATILITGGSGLIGNALTKLFVERKFDVIILSRNNNKEINGAKTALWDIEKQKIDEDAIRQADYIIHLAGANVGDKRWTKKRKKEIVDSRTKSSALIVKALKEIPNKVKVVVSASATGWYEETPLSNQTDIRRTETEPANKDFLGETCRLWEESIDPITGMNIRLVKLRTGIVLSNEGGAFPEFKKPLRFGIAAVLGNGKQIIPWIHIDDLCRIYLEAITNESLHGVYNAVAPRPVDNKTFVTSLAKKIKGKFFIPFYVPSFMLKIILGEMSIEVLKSVNVSAEKIKSTGFQFLYPTIDAAFEQLILNHD
ncbi:MAG: TIGR01777 family oxidoreductase [Bacteroidetes bacterium]|nr:TIGR01777 family oxidoreductase [Bacteroidota bacterium]